MHRVYQEMLHVFSLCGAMVAAIGSLHPERLQLWIGAAMAIGGGVWSWYLAQRAKEQERAREDRWLDFELRLRMALAAKEAGLPPDALAGGPEPE